MEKVKKYLATALVLSTIATLVFPRCGRSDPQPKKKDQRVEKQTNPAQSTSVPDSTAKKAPDFTLIALDGEEVTLAQFRGKVVILNFWATWCGPCKAEIPDLIQMYQDHRDQGLEILGITVASGSAAEISEFVKKYQINYPVLTGDEKYMQELANQYGGIRAIPTTFLIDRQGNIQKKWVGQRSASVFMRVVNFIL